MSSSDPTDLRIAPDGLPTQPEATASPAELEQVVRFALSGLGARNGHHAFEEIARHFAQRRLASNILPATGPVSAGGDQGRDAETFRTFLLDELGPHGAFLGRVSDGLAVFITTIQQDGVDRKIITDVSKVLAEGRAPTAIYVFCTGDLPVAKRHKLEKYIAKKFNGVFEVFDLEALSAHLAEPDMFWIAERYLQLPAGLAPALPDSDSALPEWYLSDRERWRERGSARMTLGDTLDLKDGLRHATRFRDARPDLPFWLGLMRPLATADAAEDVRHRARYELIWATIQAQSDVRPADELIRAFFEDLQAHADLQPYRLADASVLLTGVVIAILGGRTDLTPDEVRAWLDSIRGRLREELELETTVTRRAELLDVLAQLSLGLDPAAVEPPDQPRPMLDVLDMVDEYGEMRPVTMDRSIAPPLVDVPGAMAALTELVGLLEDARLFPASRLSKRLNFMAPLLIDEPGWREVIDSLDAAVGRLSGSAAVAAGARDRGLALHGASRFRDALHEMHTAKVEWWQGDTIRGSLLAMLIVANCYRQLGLLQAAKQYALAASYAAWASNDDDVVDLFSGGLLVASEFDYLGGAWCSALELVEAGVVIQSHHVDIEADGAANDLYTRAVSTVGFCLHLSQQLSPRFVPFVEEIARRVGFAEGLAEVIAELRDEDRDVLIARVDEQLLGRPLADAGLERVIRFAALGTDWTVTSSNRFEDARAAERFAAAVQVTLVELADEDLCLIPTSIRVRVEVADDGEPLDSRLRWAPSNEGREWLVRLERFAPDAPLSLDSQSTEILTFLAEIMIDASLLPHDAYLEALERAFARGLSHKLASVRPYDELGIPAEVYERTPRALNHPPANPRAYPAREHEQLAWRRDEGPTYVRDEALDAIERRYDMSTQATPNLLTRLATDRDFNGIVIELRERGWRDWQILQAVTNAALNDKLEREGLNRAMPEARERTMELLSTMDLDEDPSQPITIRLEDMDFHRRASLALNLRVYGLTLHQPTPDFAAIEAFLGARYSYWLDDVEHEDPFPLATQARLDAE